MIDFLKMFDSYNRQARLYPALLTFLPAILVLIVWFPALLLEDTKGVLLTLAGSTGLTFFMSDVARTRGRRLELRLLKQWGGWPTTLWLRHKDAHLDASTKQRYHAFLSGGRTNLVFPTANEEQANPDHADSVYSSAVLWLKEQCRGDQFPLVEKENITYGFRRNLAGMKPIGISVCYGALTVSIAGIGVAVYGDPQLSISGYLSKSWAINYPGILGATLFAALCLTAWIIVVRDDWVRDASDQYARALLANCDTLKNRENRGT